MRILFDIEGLLFGALNQHGLTQLLLAIEARITKIAYARYAKKIDVPLMASEVVEALWKRLKKRREKELTLLEPLNACRLCWTITRRRVLREVERLNAEKRSGETKETHYGTDVDALPIQSVDLSLREIECEEELERLLVRLTDRQKEIVCLRDEGYSTVEISSLVGITYRNVGRQSARIADKGFIRFGHLFNLSQVPIPKND